MYVAFNAPHDPRQAPKEFVDMYPPAKIKIPENYLPEHPFDNGAIKIRDEALAPFPRTKVVVQVHRSEYYAIITHMDREIGAHTEGTEEKWASRRNLRRVHGGPWLGGRTAWAHG